MKHRPRAMSVRRGVATPVEPQTKTEPQAQTEPDDAYKRTKIGFTAN